MMPVRNDKRAGPWHLLPFRSGSSIRNMLLIQSGSDFLFRICPGQTFFFHICLYQTYICLYQTFFRICFFQNPIFSISLP